MKTCYIFAVMAAAAVMSAACTRELTGDEAPEGKRIVLTASAESGLSSRTCVTEGGTEVYWQPGDAISVFTKSSTDGGDKFVSTNTVPSATVDFEGTLSGNEGGPVSDFWCLYPYSDKAEFDASTGVFTFFLPDIQEAMEGSFGPGMYPSLGFGTLDEPFTMYAVCGGMKFTVQTTGIRYIKLKDAAAPLNGTVKAYLGSDGIPVIQSLKPMSPYTTVVAPGDGEFIPGKEYFVVLPGIETPVAHTLSLTYIKTDGSFASYESNSYPGAKRATFGVVRGIDAKAGSYSSMQPVDLGLSVKWAPFNLGAMDETEYGFYYAWGETEPKSVFSFPTYKYCKGKSTQLTKYCCDASYGYEGYSDDLTVLEPEDDAAVAMLGGYWRMPSKDEVAELRSNCTLEWTENYKGSGINGLLLTSNKDGFTGVTLFLPACGQRYSTVVSNLGRYGIYWTSDLDTDTPRQAWHATFASAISTVSEGRHFGNCVRAVWDEHSDEVRSVVIEKKKYALSAGESKKVAVHVYGGAWADKRVTWQSSAPDIVKVEQDGTVTVLSEGKATITATSVSGGLSDYCEVRWVKPLTPLGESFTTVWQGFKIRWASYNLGATAPEETGDYYAWGSKETTSYYSWGYYPFSKGNGYTLTKYCSKADYGWGDMTDDLTELEPGDDIVYELLGGAWRMPTREEWEELLYHPRSSVKWTEVNGVKCLAVTNSMAGGTVFLPAAGCIDGDEVYNKDKFGLYWSSTLNTDDPRRAYCAKFPAAGESQADVTVPVDLRYKGLPIRPVRD